MLESLTERDLLRRAMNVMQAKKLLLDVAIEVLEDTLREEEAEHTREAAT